MPKKEKKNYISLSGYHVLKKSLTDSELKKLKEELTVSPLNNDYVNNVDNNQISYNLYDTSKSYIIIPKHFGLKRFGPCETRYNYEHMNKETRFKGELRDYQKPIIQTCMDKLEKHNGGILSVGCGQGKCLGYNTPVLMFDGSIKYVQDIKQNDLIMGDDSTPRKILSLARGKEQMYKIIDLDDFHTFKLNYKVNESHILSLKYIGNDIIEIDGFEYKHNDVVDICIKSYLKLNDSIKNDLKGYRTSIKAFKHSSDYKLNYNSYKFGLNMGRIFSNKITDEVVNFVKSQLNINNIEKLDKKKLTIPDKYKYNTIKNRTQLIKGFIDSCGYAIHAQEDDSVIGYEFSSIQSEDLIEDLIFISRSIGYKTFYENMDFTKYPFCIYLSNEPSYTYDIKVEPCGISNYYGFEINKNKRFVLGDFTITHNTSMAIYMGVKLHLKMLVLTHKTFLLDQWVDRVKFFTNAKVGIIRQDLIDVEGKDIVIGMVQSIYRRDYDPKIFEQFGIICVDECHHFASKQFSKALSKLNTKYTIGLTATPKRTDGLIDVLYWFLGDIMYKGKLKTNNQVVVKQITYFSKHKLFKEKKRKVKFELKADTVSMITNICKIDTRTQVIIDIINELRRDPTRKILILSGRKEHLSQLKNSTDDAIKRDIENKIILQDECRSYYYTGDVKRNDRIEAEKYGDILFATYDMAHEGLDIDRLNTVILATPKKDVVQSVGRILRKILKNGDVRPLIIDIIDDLSVFKSQSYVRQRFYKQSQYELHKFYIGDRNILSPQEYRDYNTNEDNKAPLNISFKPKNFKELLEVLPVEIKMVENNNTTSSESDKDDYKNNTKINIDVCMFSDFE